MTEKELLNGFLSKTLNLDETGVAALYNAEGTELKTDALELLLGHDVKRVDALKKSSEKDGRSKAKAEVLSTFEKETQERFGIKSDKKGIELIDQIISEKSKPIGGVSSEDEIKKLPYVVALIDKHQKEVETIRTEEAGKLTQFQKELSKKETLSKVLEKGNEVFVGLKPILPQDAAKAKNASDLFLSNLAKEFEFEIQGDQIIITKDGKLLEDKHGNRVKFEALIKDASDKVFDYHVAEPRSSTGNGKPDPKKTNTTNPIAVPKTEAEYVKIAHDQSIPIADRIAIKQAYEASKQPV